MTKHNQTWSKVHGLLLLVPCNLTPKAGAAHSESHPHPPHSCLFSQVWVCLYHGCTHVPCAMRMCLPTVFCNTTLHFI